MGEKDGKTDFWGKLAKRLFRMLLLLLAGASVKQNYQEMLYSLLPGLISAEWNLQNWYEELLEMSST